MNFLKSIILLAVFACSEKSDISQNRDIKDSGPLLESPTEIENRLEHSKNNEQENIIIFHYHPQIQMNATDVAQYDLKIDEPFTIKPHIISGKPNRFELEGSLPEGLELNTQSGEISGIVRYHHNLDKNRVVKVIATNNKQISSRTLVNFIIAQQEPNVFFKYREQQSKKIEISLEYEEKLEAQLINLGGPGKLNVNSLQLSRRGLQFSAHKMLIEGNPLVSSLDNQSLLPKSFQVIASIENLQGKSTARLSLLKKAPTHSEPPKNCLDLSAQSLAFKKAGKKKDSLLRYMVDAGESEAVRIRSDLILARSLQHARYSNGDFYVHFKRSEGIPYLNDVNQLGCQEVELSFENFGKLKYRINSFYSNRDMIGEKPKMERLYLEKLSPSSGPPILVFQKNYQYDSKMKLIKESLQVTRTAVKTISEMQRCNGEMKRENLNLYISELFEYQSGSTISVPWTNIKWSKHIESVEKIGLELNFCRYQ